MPSSSNAAPPSVLYAIPNAGNVDLDVYFLFPSIMGFLLVDISRLFDITIDLKLNSFPSDAKVASLSQENPYRTAHPAD